MTSTLPVVRSTYASSTAEEAWEALSQMYTGARPHSDSRDASVNFSGAATEDIAVDRAVLSNASGRFDESPDQLNIISMVTGQISLDFGRGGRIMNAAGDSYLYPPDRAGDLEWDTFGAITVRMSPQVVARAASEVTGLKPEELRFASPRPVSAEHARLWFRTVHMLWHELTAPGHVEINALVHQELVNLTAVTMMTVFPNTAMTRGYVPGPGDVRPAAVRRAVAYIDASASLPISVTDIAHAAGASPRALRDAFRRHLETTPTAYLRRARLEGAHRDLQDADPTSRTAMREIATRWGFARLDRFIAAYYDAFGSTPSLAPPG